MVAPLPAWTGKTPDIGAYEMGRKRGWILILLGIR